MANNSTAVSNSNVIPFDFRGHNVRTVLLKGEPWFVAVDACKVLGLANATTALLALDEDERSKYAVGKFGVVNIVNESGLYTLILRCRDAVTKGSKAHAFRRWVTTEVLPSIRKAGGYLDTTVQMPSLVEGLVGVTELTVIKGLIRQKGSALHAGLQRSVGAKTYSALNTRFNVARTELIPHKDFAEACNFIAAYQVHEGEYLEKEDSTQQRFDFPVETLTARRPGMMTVRNSEQAWLDVTLHDLRDIRGEGTPLEQLIWSLEKSGYDVEGAWWELRTYRNKVREFQSFAVGMNRMIEDPHRYAITPRTAA